MESPDGQNPNTLFAADWENRMLMAVLLQKLSFVMRVCLPSVA